jgi:signal transduction histidine kinase
LEQDLQQCQEQLRNADALAKQFKDQYESIITYICVNVLAANQVLTKQLAAANDTVGQLTQQKDALTKEKADLTSILILA